MKNLIVLLLSYIAFACVVNQSYELRKAQTVNKIFKTWFDINKGTDLNLDLMYENWQRQPK